MRASSTRLSAPMQKLKDTHSVEYKLGVRTNRVREVNYLIRECTCAAPGHKVYNLLVPNKKSYWMTSSGRNHEIKLELETAVLGGYLVVCNRGTASIEIRISIDDSPGSYYKVNEDERMPRHKPTSYSLGFLPARFIKIRLPQGQPTSLYYLRVTGVPHRSLLPGMGPVLYRALWQRTGKLMYSGAHRLPRQLHVRDTGGDRAGNGAEYVGPARQTRKFPLVY